MKVIHLAVRVLSGGGPIPFLDPSRLTNQSEGSLRMCIRFSRGFRTGGPPCSWGQTETGKWPLPRSHPPRGYGPNGVSWNVRQKRFPLKLLSLYSLEQHSIQDPRQDWVDREIGGTGRHKSNLPWTWWRGPWSQCSGEGNPRFCDPKRGGVSFYRSGLL